jgi:quercetin dioxygenase-like cupin family protein
MKIVGLGDVESQPVEMEGARGACKQVPIAAADGSPLMALRVFTFEPGGCTPRHRHPYEHINYIIGGRGTLEDEDGQRRPLIAGDFALVLPDELHRYRNDSTDEPLVMICLVPREFE